MFAAGASKALANEFRDLAGPFESTPESGIIFATIANITDPSHDSLGTQRIIFRQPFFEQAFDFTRQS